MYTAFIKLVMAALLGPPEELNDFTKKEFFI
jgi:hypothetical protein